MRAVRIFIAAASLPNTKIFRENINNTKVGLTFLIRATDY